MEVAFRNVVERIFSNWTALKLAVDYMGGANGRQVWIKNDLIFCDLTVRFIGSQRDCK